MIDKIASGYNYLWKWWDYLDYWYDDRGSFVNTVGEARAVEFNRNR